MLRSRAVLTVPIVLAIVLIGVFAIRSRGADNPELNTNERENCAPVARADVVATRPGIPVTVDVLANDTDADGDPLVFQVLKANGGTAQVDDRGTEFDGADDRVVFVPAEPSVPQADVRYQAVDPDGASAASVITVFVNGEGVVPAGVASEPTSEGSGRCGATPMTSTTASPATTSTTIADSEPRPSVGGRSSRPPTTRRGATTPTRPGSSVTQSPGPTTTRPTGPTTTRPSSPPPTFPRECGPPPTSNNEADEERWEECIRNSGD